MGGSAQPPDGGAGRVLSLAPLTVLELDPAELVQCAAQTGYDAVGFRLIRATEQEPIRPTIGTTALIRETKRRLDDSGLRLLDVEVVRLAPETRVRRDFEAFLETGAFLGATEALVTGYDPDHRRIADNLTELALLAAEFGITLNLEPMPWTEVRNLHEGAALVGQCPGNVGLLIDAIHYDRALSTPAELQALPREWIRYAQICDAPAQRPADMAELMRQGATPDEAIAEALDRIIKRVPTNRSVQAAFVAIRRDGLTGAGSIGSGFQYVLTRGAETEVVDVTARLQEG